VGGNPHAPWVPLVNEVTHVALRGCRLVRLRARVHSLAGGAGSGTLAGRGGKARTRPGRIAPRRARAVVRSSWGYHPHGGGRALRFPGAPDVLKMACGENPKRVYGAKSVAPSTRMGNLRGQREAFFAAQRYRDDWRRWREKSEHPPAKKGKKEEPGDKELPA